MAAVNGYLLIELIADDRYHYTKQPPRLWSSLNCIHHAHITQKIANVLIVMQPPREQYILIWQYAK